MYPTQFSADLPHEADRVIQNFLLPKIKSGDLSEVEVIAVLEAACENADWKKVSIPTNHSEIQMLDFFKKITATLKQTK